MSEAEHAERYAGAAFRDVLASALSGGLERIHRLGRPHDPQIRARRNVLELTPVHNVQIRTEASAQPHASFGAFAVQDGLVHAYREEAFHYFLELERKRCEAAHRPLVLLLIDRETGGAEIDAATSAKVFSIVSRSVRDTDFIGWYREGRIVGAVLTQDTESARESLADVVRGSIIGKIENRFRAGSIRNLRLRVQPVSHMPQAPADPVLHEDLFKGMLVRERKRADRSNQPRLLLMVELAGPLETEPPSTWQAVVDVLVASKSDTDVIGWFERNQSIGLLLSDVPSEESTFTGELIDRVQQELSHRLATPAADRVSIRLHTYLGPNMAEGYGLWRDERHRGYDALKRVLDVVLSLILLAVLSPLFAVIAALLKLTSPGSVFFRQERVGQMMKPFRMLKFRTMQVNADHTIHYQFVSSLIKGEGGTGAGANGGVFKIPNDPRVTAIGRVLRRTSIDELPQLWNVLRGEMSLVGPRPPLPYEVDQYKWWHRRRVLEAKPGMTGFWQVAGRSRTSFDEMVRLDLRYARSTSAWTDIKILMATPRAVISGKGAY